MILGAQYVCLPRRKTYTKPGAKSPGVKFNMVKVSKKQLEQLELIKNKLSKMTMKQRMKLLNDKGVKKLMKESEKEMKKKDGDV